LTVRILDSFRQLPEAASTVVIIGGSIIGGMALVMIWVAVLALLSWPVRADDASPTQSMTDDDWIAAGLKPIGRYQMMFAPSIKMGTSDGAPVSSAIWIIDTATGRIGMCRVDTSTTTTVVCGPQVLWPALEQGPWLDFQSRSKTTP
jgi:hypothetical protein